MAHALEDLRRLVEQIMMAQPSPSDPKGHHLVPRFYLERFAEGGRLITVRRGESKKIATSPKRAAVENGFYTVERNGQETQALEKFLGVIESGVAPIMARMTRPGSFPFKDERDRALLAMFLALQHARGRVPRDMLIQGHEKFSELLKRIGPAERTVRTRLRKTLEREPTVDEVQAARSAARERWRVAPTPELHKNFLNETILKAFDKLLPLVAMRAWVLVRFKAPRLLTTDEPVAPFPGGGVANAQVVFPVDPLHALVLATRSAPDTVIDGNEQDAFELNSVVADQSYTWLYHRPNHDPLAKLSLSPRAPLVVAGWE